MNRESNDLKIMSPSEKIERGDKRLREENEALRAENERLRSLTSVFEEANAARRERWSLEAENKELIAERDQMKKALWWFAALAPAWVEAYFNKRYAELKAHNQGELGTNMSEVNARELVETAGKLSGIREEST